MNEPGAEVWSLTRAVRAFADGEPVLVAAVDGRGANVAAAASRITGSTLTAVDELGGDLVMLTISTPHAERLGLAPLPRTTRERDGVTPAVSIDAIDRRRDAGSPAGRAQTIRVASDPACDPGMLTSPGHVHTAIAPGGTETAPTLSLELARLAGCSPAVVLCPVVDAAGRPLTLAEALELVGPTRLVRAPAVELRSHAIARELEQAVVRCSLPTRMGSFRAVALAGRPDGETALALVHGDPQLDPASAVVRTHLACMLGDTFGSTLCDCRARLEQATREILAAGSGVIVYVRSRAADPLSCPGGREPDRALTRRALGDAGLCADRIAA
jgi:3,4-dihydroxy 2-butanone 4-phosphate synthase/GTP cyclohydrolase II